MTSHVTFGPFFNLFERHVHPLFLYMLHDGAPACPALRNVLAVHYDERNFPKANSNMHTATKWFRKTVRKIVL